MVLKRKQNGKLRKKLATFIFALVLTTSAGVAVFAADSDTTGTAPVAPVATGATAEAGGKSENTDPKTSGLEKEYKGEMSEEGNKSTSNLYAPNSTLYGDILAKDSKDSDDKYNTESDATFKTEAGAKLDFKAVLDGKNVEKQYKGILENAINGAGLIKKNPIALGVNKDGIIDGSNIDITENLNANMLLVIDPDPELIFPTNINDYILNAKDTDNAGNERVWYYIDENKSDVAGATKKIYMQLNYKNDSEYYKKINSEYYKEYKTNIARDGAVTIKTYADLAPFIVGPDAKIKTLDLVINGVKVKEDAKPGIYTVRSGLNGTFESNPKVFGTLWSNLTDRLSNTEFFGIKFSDLGYNQEDTVKFNWNTIQDEKGKDFIQNKESDNTPWFSIEVIKKAPDRPPVPVNPDRDPLLPTIPGIENEKLVTPEVKPEENTPVVPEKPEVPSQPEVKPNVPTKENSKVVKKSTANKLPQMGVSTIAGATTAIGTVLAAASALTFKKRK